MTGITGRVFPFRDGEDSGAEGISRTRTGSVFKAFFCHGGELWISGDHFSALISRTPPFQTR